MNRIIIIIVVLLLPVIGIAITRHVPSEYATIQAGIDAALAGDTVLVANGTYTGIGNKNLDFLGKAIVVTSANGPNSCIIDCQYEGRGFYLHSGENSNSVISGFKISNGFISYPGWGGGINLDGSSGLIISTIIINCIIYANTAPGGGGISCVHAIPMISNCTISQNTATLFSGGGIYYGIYGGGWMNNCIISENQANIAGGGIYGDMNYWVTINNSNFWGNSAQGGGGIANIKGGFVLLCCDIHDNSADVGGGFCLSLGNYFLKFCTITRNRATGSGGAIYSYTEDLAIQNCNICNNSALENAGAIWLVDGFTGAINNSIITDNTGNGAIYFNPSWPSYAQITYNNFCSNENGNFSGNVPPQLGQLAAINVNGDSCDVFHNIFVDPLFVNPPGGNYNLTWVDFPVPDSTLSPCIDAGCPDSLKDPDSTVADIGAFYFDQGSVLVTLTPDSFPVVVAPGGGSFSYSVDIMNHASQLVHVDIWCQAILPNGQSSRTLLGPVAVTLPANTGLSRLRNQAVPGSAPTGSYHYVYYLGHYPDFPSGSDFIPVTKLGSGIQVSGGGDWLITGEPFPGEPSQMASLPSGLELGVNPNPFNPSTTLTYELPAASLVHLQVFDTAGRVVATLVNGWTPVGSHEVVFDGSGLASGLYLYHLTATEGPFGAGENTATGKMLLLK